MKHADKSKRTRNLCNAAMLCCAAAVLLTGLGRTLLRPKDVNYYENRPANTVAPLTAESWLDGSFSGRHGGCAQRSDPAGAGDEKDLQ